MKKTNRFEIWATFEDGIEALVEVHKTRRSAESAIGAMNAHNRNDIALGAGFPHGVPIYEIR